MCLPTQLWAGSHHNFQTFFRWKHLILLLVQNPLSITPFSPLKFGGSDSFNFTMRVLDVIRFKAYRDKDLYNLSSVL